MLNSSSWTLIYLVLCNHQKAFLKLWAWQMRGCQKATIACRSRRPNDSKFCKLSALYPNLKITWGEGRDYSFSEFFVSLAASTKWLLIFTVLFPCLLRLRLQTYFKFSSQAARRSFHVGFQNPPLPSKAPILPSLSCSTARQWSRAAEVSCAFGQPSLAVSQLWGLQPEAHYERQPSKVMGCCKLCYSIFLLSFPTHCSCQGQGFFWQYSKHTSYRLLSWVKI